jgi:hypothetical protein
MCSCRCVYASVCVCWIDLELVVATCQPVQIHANIIGRIHSITQHHMLVEVAYARVDVVQENAVGDGIESCHDWILIHMFVNCIRNYHDPMRSRGRGRGLVVQEGSATRGAADEVVCGGGVLC